MIIYSQCEGCIMLSLKYPVSARRVSTRKSMTNITSHRSGWASRKYMVQTTSYIDVCIKREKNHCSSLNNGMITSRLNATDMCNMLQIIAPHYVNLQKQHRFKFRRTEPKKRIWKARASVRLYIQKNATYANCADLSHRKRRNLNYFS